MGSVPRRNFTVGSMYGMPVLHHTVGLLERDRRIRLSRGDYLSVVFDDPEGDEEAFDAPLALRPMSSTSRMVTYEVLRKCVILPQELFRLRSQMRFDRYVADLEEFIVYRNMLKDRLQSGAYG